MRLRFKRGRFSGFLDSFRRSRRLRPSGRARRGRYRWALIAPGRRRGGSGYSRSRRVKRKR